MPEYTADVSGVGTLRILDAIRSAGLTNSVKFYQVRLSTAAQLVLALCVPLIKFVCGLLCYLV